jgi:hypothetical protein
MLSQHAAQRLFLVFPALVDKLQLVVAAGDDEEVLDRFERLEDERIEGDIAADEIDEGISQAVAELAGQPFLLLRIARALFVRVIVVMVVIVIVRHENLPFVWDYTLVPAGERHRTLSHGKIQKTNRILRD